MSESSGCRASRNTSPNGSPMNFPTSCTIPWTPRLPPLLTIQSDGTRMSSAYGHTGKGRYLDEYLGPDSYPL